MGGGDYGANMLAILKGTNATKTIINKVAVMRRGIVLNTVSRFMLSSCGL
jgi:hypothetical protein